MIDDWLLSLIYAAWLAASTMPLGLMLGSSCSTCCGEGECTVTGGIADGGPGTTETVLTGWPSRAQEFYFCYDAKTIPDTFIVAAGGQELLNTGSISGDSCVCLEKPQGPTEVTITVEGPENTLWDWTLECQCPPPPACDGECVGDSCQEKQQPCYCCDGECQDEPCDCCLASVVGRTALFEGKEFTIGTPDTIIDGNTVWEHSSLGGGRYAFTRTTYLDDECVNPLTIPVEQVEVSLQCDNGVWIVEASTYCLTREVDENCEITNTGYAARLFFGEISCFVTDLGQQIPSGPTANIVEAEDSPFLDPPLPDCGAPEFDFGLDVFAP